VLTVLWECTPCCENAHCAVRVHIMLWECTSCCESAHCAVRLHTVLWKCTLCYDSTHCAMTVHTVLWQYTLCYDSTHCAMTVHTVLWQYTLCCQHNIQQFSMQTHTSYKWQYSVQSTITKILNTHAFYAVRFEVLKAVLLNIHVFWDGSLCCRVSGYWSVTGSQCLDLQGQAILHLKMNMLCYFATCGTTHTATLCHISQNLNAPFMLILNF